MAADDFQWVFNPANWSDKKVFAKFRSFGECSDHQLRIEDRSLMNEEIGVTVEVIKRVRDLREVYIHRCFLGDASFETIADPLTKHSRLSTLSLRSNNLAHRAVDFLVRKFSTPKFNLSLGNFGSSVSLEELDLRGNKLSGSEVAALYTAFNFCKSLNGIPVFDIRSDSSLKALQLSRQELHFPEMVLLCLVIQDNVSIEHIDLSYNLFDAKALNHLVATLDGNHHIHSLDLSYNPMMTGSKGDDLSGLESLRNLLQRRPHITSLSLTGIHIPGPLLKQIELSLQVNRSVAGSGDEKRFEAFVHSLVQRTGPPPKDNPLKDWKPSFDIDVAFCLHNPVERCSLEHNDKGFKVVPYESPDKPA